VVRRTIGLAGPTRDRAAHPRATISRVDPLSQDDIETMRASTAEEKARQAFDLMRTGIRMKRAGLRARNPDASVEEIDAMLRAWLEADE